LLYTDDVIFLCENEKDLPTNLADRKQHRNLIYWQKTTSESDLLTENNIGI
jgi:hypothetical protein